MSWLKTVATEFAGLFVDDGSLAVAVLVWIGACRLVLPRLGFASAWAAPVLFAGLVLILAESALRRAGRRG